MIPQRKSDFVEGVYYARWAGNDPTDPAGWQMVQVSYSFGRWEAVVFGNDGLWPMREFAQMIGPLPTKDELVGATLQHYEPRFWYADRSE